MQEDQGRLDRSYWLEMMLRIGDPVLRALAEGRLKRDMPVESSPDGKKREWFTHLEALGRLLSGMAPWLENAAVSGEEGMRRDEYAALARKAIDAGTDPDSPDYMNFTYLMQPIVDGAFLAHALLRAPTELTGKLEPRVRKNVISALQATRNRLANFSNWLLFAAVIEAALKLLGEEWDRMRVDYAVRQHEQWYVGDGMYGDGPEFHWDYYNSFVIQPMLLAVLDTVGREFPYWTNMKGSVLLRARRYAVVQERLISPEGTYPAVGRSLAYRFGAFQHLADMALRQELEPALSPAQVRCALTAVIKRTMAMPDNFDANGWLTIGLCGHQPEIGESYISTGSLYLCSTVFPPLGLAENNPFWVGEADWTMKKLWSGQKVLIDKALK